MTITGKMLITIILIECAWNSNAKFHKHLSRKIKHKRDDTWGQKLSDLSGNPSLNTVVNQNYVGAENQAPQIYNDYNTLSKQNLQDVPEKDYSQFMKISQQELNAAYQMVNSGQFDNSLNTNKVYSNEQKGQMVTKQNGNLESIPKESLNYVELNNHETQVNTVGTNNLLGNDMFHGSDGFKKSGVPETRQSIPANETHPEGIHTHLTDTAIITHKDNDSNFHAVSRYPPHITKDGKSVSGPSNLINFKPKSDAQNLSLQYDVKNEDDIRCINYTTSICFHSWMKKHCANMCKNFTSVVEEKVKPPLQNLTNSYKSCLLPSYGGNSYGSCCSVPFVFSGKPQYGCILQPGLGYWCGTTSNFDQDQKWGMCGSCIQLPCQTTTTFAPTTTTVSTTTTAKPTTLSTTTTTIAPTTTIASTTTTTEVPTTLTTTTSTTTTTTTTMKPTTTTTTSKPVLVCEEWTAWSDCSTSCGFGKRLREKVCREGGRAEKLIASKQCYMSDCPPLCNPWSDYSECSKTCGGGVQEHKRNCSITDNIQVDVLEFTESRLCNTKPCPTEWTPWNEWSECTLTCGSGYQYRNRVGSWEDLGRIISTPQTQTRNCNTQECPPRCENWAEWSECSKSCNSGKKERFRLCYSVKNNSPFREEDVQICNQINCYPPYCGQWSAYTECTASCLGGIMSRWRTCDGVYNEQNITCNEVPCPTTTSEPSTCSEWGEWSPCSATCNGMQTRIHHCKNNTHEADELQARPCNTLPKCLFTPPTPTTELSTSPVPITTTTTTTTTTPIPTTTTAVPTTTLTTTTEPTTTTTATTTTASTTTTTTVPTTTTTPTTTSTTTTTTPTTTSTTTTATTTTASTTTTTPTKETTVTPSTLTTEVTWTGCTGWSSWSECAQPCGGGYQERYRTCLKLQQDIETRACNLHPCVTTTPVPLTPIIPIKECIVAHWSFDNVDVSRNIIYDEGPFGNHAQYNGDVTFLHGNYSCRNATLIKNGEIWFNTPAFQNVPVNGLTIAVWVFADSTTFSQSLFPFGILDFNIELEAGKIKWTKMDKFGRTYFLAISDTVYSDQRWFHLALVYNATSYQSTIYINAVNVTTAGTVGATESYRFNKFHGFIDELYIYNCSLSAEQIRIVANTCKGTERGGCPSPALGVCPVCHTCSSNGTTTPAPIATTDIPPSNESVIYSSNYPSSNTLSVSSMNNPLIEMMSLKKTPFSPSSELPKGYFPKHEKFEKMNSSSTNHGKSPDQWLRRSNFNNHAEILSRSSFIVFRQDEE